MKNVTIAGGKSVKVVNHAMRSVTHLGPKIRTVRRQAGLTQAALAARLGISPSYLNLLEHDRRPVTAELLLQLAKALDVDLRSLAAGADARLLADVTEALSDPVLEDHPVMGRDVQSFVESSPEIARAFVRLHSAYAATRAALETLQSRVLEDPDYATAVPGPEATRLSSEQVSDFIQQHSNYFPELEAEAERIWAAARLEQADLSGGLTRYLERVHRISVRILTVREMAGAMRRFDPAKREIHLSEALTRGSRHFELAAQVGFLECSEQLDRILADGALNSEESRALGRVALGNYFAAAVLMPYQAFLRAAEQERYDIEILGHRFDTRWEQTCHRLTTLHRPGAEGIPFYFVRVDIAGNISKRFSAAGIHFPRYSGLCGLWNVHAAFLQPGQVRVQWARLPNGKMVLAIARTVQRHGGGFRAPDSLYAVGIGCDVADAKRLVYGDGIDINASDAAVPVGVTCRLCERNACKARATPALHQPLRIDENVRGISFFAPVST